MVEAATDLLSVVGCVREHGGHVKHQLVVLVGGVEGVRPRGVRWNTKQDRSFKVSDFLTKGQYIKYPALSWINWMYAFGTECFFFYLTLVIQLSSVLGEAFEAHPLA